MGAYKVFRKKTGRVIKFVIWGLKSEDVCWKSVAQSALPLSWKGNLRLNSEGKKVKGLVGPMTRARCWAGPLKSSFTSCLIRTSLAVYVGKQVQQMPLSVQPLACFGVAKSPPLNKSPVSNISHFTSSLLAETWLVCLK